MNPAPPVTKILIHSLLSAVHRTILFVHYGGCTISHLSEPDEIFSSFLTVSDYCNSIDSSITLCCENLSKCLQHHTILGEQFSGTFHRVHTLSLIHILKALKKIEENAGLKIYNLGTGVGYSVLDIVKNFEAATGVKIPYVIKPRRAGDIATCYSDASLAEKELGWKAENGIKEMCEDSWRWQKNNPNGYEE